MPATVSSQTTLIPKPLTIITFNKADVVYQAYNHLYQVASFGQSGVEAGADVWGLKVGIVYGSVGVQTLYRMWFCPNGLALSFKAFIMIRFGLMVATT